MDFLSFLRIKTKNVMYWEGDDKNLYKGLEHAKNVYWYIKAIIFLFEPELKVALGHYTVTLKM